MQSRFISELDSRGPSARESVSDQGGLQIDVVAGVRDRCERWMEKAAHLQTIRSMPYGSMTRGKKSIEMHVSPLRRGLLLAWRAATSCSRHVGHVERAYGAARGRRA